MTERVAEFVANDKGYFFAHMY